MEKGSRRLRYATQILPVTAYNGPRHDVAVFYGFDMGLETVFSDFRRAGKPVVYVDLGYFERKYGGRMMGYHKVSLNGRHPDKYFQNIVHDNDRASALKIEIKPWRKSGEHILLCGMSDRAAKVAGYGPEEWERWAVNEIRKYSDRPIIYRPKPNYVRARKISGTEFAHNGERLETALENCHAVVSHHSNAGIEALMQGYPVFTVEGVALAGGLSDLSLIEKPRMDADRQQILNDLAYCQFHVGEMETGLALKCLQQDGLIPV